MGRLGLLRFGFDENLCVFFFSFLFFYVVSIDRVCVLLVEIFLTSFCDILKVDFRSSQFWRTVTSLYRLSFDQFILETQIEYIHE